MGNFGLNSEVPWFYDTESRALGFVIYAKKMRATLVKFFLNARPSEIMLKLSVST